jgi:putative MATE family efflux protein
MLGSAAQNVIALIDSVFLYHLSELDFAAIGFVGVFYLTVAAIGYGFSKGGQIIIARRLGEGNTSEVGRAFRVMLTFELVLATVLFLFMQFGTPWFFGLLVDSPQVLEKSLEYLEYRSWGVFFAYAGVSIIALYTGIAQTRFIIWDTIFMALVNGILCYSLIFGHWGMPAMGIAGAGLSSTIAEIAALGVFIIYMVFDKKIRQFTLIRFHAFSWDMLRLQYQVSTPIIAQMVVGLGSWFLFFSIVENLGERELAITNLVRMVYLVLCIPTWGYASGVNTMVSGFIGMKKRQAVIPITWKTAKASWLSTMVIAIPILLFPTFFLYPLLGKTDMSLITDAQPIFYVLFGILTAFSIGAVFFNGLAGTGATLFGLKLQGIAVVFYVVYVYLIIETFEMGLAWAWAAEIFYWIFLLFISIWYLRSGKWHWLKIWKTRG